VATGRSLVQEDEQGIPQRHPGAYASECELAQPGGGVLLSAAKEGPRAERLGGLTRAGIAYQAVRGTDQPRATAVRLEVHQVRPVRPAAAPCLAGSRQAFAKPGLIPPGDPNPTVICETDHLAASFA